MASLVKLWISLGLPYSEFWALTLNEVNTIIQGALDGMENRSKDLRSALWLASTNSKDGITIALEHWGFSSEASTKKVKGKRSGYFDNWRDDLGK